MVFVYRGVVNIQPRWLIASLRTKIPYSHRRHELMFLAEERLIQEKAYSQVMGKAKEGARSAEKGHERKNHPRRWTR